MRRFALLTAVFALVLGAYAIGLPSANAYVEGVDDGPPQQFKDIAAATRAAGYEFPHLANYPGWRIEAIVVTPVHYNRKLLEELSQNPNLRRFPNGEYSISIGVPFAAPSSVQNYVDVTYSSDDGAYVTLSVNRRRTLPAVLKTPGEPLIRDEERVRIQGQLTRLITQRTSASEVMYTDWVHDEVPITVTAFNFPNRADFPLTRDELLDLLEAVR